jgi:hypothetical protein
MTEFFIMVRGMGTEEGRTASIEFHAPRVIVLVLGVVVRKMPAGTPALPFV